MIGVIGEPGNIHHEWRHFPRYGTVDGETCVAWVDRRRREKLDENPALATLPTEIISDKEASHRRWQDGTRIYVRVCWSTVVR